MWILLFLPALGRVKILNERTRVIFIFFFLYFSLDEACSFVRARLTIEKVKGAGIARVLRTHVIARFEFERRIVLRLFSSDAFRDDSEFSFQILLQRNCAWLYKSCNCDGKARNDERRFIRQEKYLKMNSTRAQQPFVIRRVAGLNDNFRYVEKKER